MQTSTYSCEKSRGGRRYFELTCHSSRGQGIVLRVTNVRTRGRIQPPCDTGCVLSMTSHECHLVWLNACMFKFSEVRLCSCLLWGDFQEGIDLAYKRNS